MTPSPARSEKGSLSFVHCTQAHMPAGTRMCFPRTACRSVESVDRAEPQARAAIGSWYWFCRDSSSQPCRGHGPSPAGARWSLDAGRRRNALARRQVSSCTSGRNGIVPRPLRSSLTRRLRRRMRNFISCWRWQQPWFWRPSAGRRNLG